MQSLNRPASTVLVRYPQARTVATALPQRLEMVALYLLISAFWGIVLFVALTQAL
jgi:hypothetical protein